MSEGEVARRAAAAEAAGPPEESPEAKLEARFGKGWIEKYRGEWTGGEPHMFSRETFGDWHPMAVKKE